MTPSATGACCSDGAAVEVVDEAAEVGAVGTRELDGLVDQRLQRLPAVAGLAARGRRLRAPAHAGEGGAHGLDQVVAAPGRTGRCRGAG